MKKNLKTIQNFAYVFYASVVVTLLGTVVPFVLAKRTISADDPGKLNFASSDLNAFLKDFFPWALAVSGGIAVIVLIWSGYMYMTSAGNIEQVNKSKELIVGTFSGLAFLILAGLIYNSLQSTP